MSVHRLTKYLLLFFVVSTLITGQAQADADRVTKGDVMAVFEAFITGGRVILAQSNGGVFSAAPIDQFDGSIRPFPGSPWDDGRFCVDDWHVLLIALFEGGDESYMRQEAERVFALTQLEFRLDDESISTGRTAVKRALAPERFGFAEAYAFQEGAIFAPDELSVGEHSFVVDVDSPTMGTLQFPITFFVDPSDSETCTG